MLVHDETNLIHSAVLQLYPESAEQIEMITTIPMRCGFSGGLVVDFPNRCVGPGMEEGGGSPMRSVCRGLNVWTTYPVAC